MELLLKSTMGWMWLPFDIRWTISNRWLESWRGFKASLNSVFRPKQLSSFPAGENPFWHDLYHMGTYVNDDVLVMYDSQSKYVILVHKPSGQRMQISFVK